MWKCPPRSLENRETTQCSLNLSAGLHFTFLCHIVLLISNIRSFLGNKKDRMLSDPLMCITWFNLVGLLQSALAWEVYKQGKLFIQFWRLASPPDLVPGEDPLPVHRQCHLTESLRGWGAGLARKPFRVSLLKVLFPFPRSTFMS